MAIFCYVEHPFPLCLGKKLKPKCLMVDRRGVPRVTQMKAEVEVDLALSAFAHQIPAQHLLCQGALICLELPG